MKEVVIHIENLSKKFFINRQKTLKKSFSAFVKRMLLSGVGESKESFYALKEINLDVFEGDVIGIIGHNGSGKSTLLRIIAGITTPSSGKVLVRRKMVSVLDVGMGFHNELSGRDNVFLCCAFYGIPRSETEKLMASIINFSNIGTFIDTPVKHYSKGMYLRLAFSIIIYIDAGILVFDEAISVGDQEFKNKIFNRIKELNAEGKTIVIVSHKMEEILALTNKCLLLNKGEALLFDTSYLVVNKYFSLVKNSLKNIAQNSSTATKNEVLFTQNNIDFHNRILIKSFLARGAAKEPHEAIYPEDEIVFNIFYTLNAPDLNIIFSVNISDMFGNTIVLASDIYFKRTINQGSIKASFSILPYTLNEGWYAARLMVYNNFEPLLKLTEELVFCIENPNTDSRLSSFPCPVFPRYNWTEEIIPE